MTSELALPDLAEAVVDTVREPLILVDAGLRVVKVNRSFCRVFDTNAADALGHPLASLGDGQWDIPALREVLGRAAEGGGPCEGFEVDREFPRIGRRFMLLNARLLRQAPEAAPLVLVAVEDITERRRIAQELERQAVELARSNRDLEEFAYVASHDLQEPLRMVVSYTQLIAKRYKGKLDSDADDFIAFAVDGAKRMQTLISDLLAYSRLDRPAASTEPADCAKALAEALGSLSLALEDSGAKVESHDLPAVRAEYGQVVQLLHNLVANAVKFKSDKTPVVRVSAERDGAWQRFRVEDNGIGIDPRHYERVFVIFERLHGVEVPGSGIGLAICRKIVQRHGGRIWLEPARDGGAAVLFTLPAHQGA